MQGQGGTLRAVEREGLTHACAGLVVSSQLVEYPRVCVYECGVSLLEGYRPRRHLERPLQIAFLEREVVGVVVEYGCVVGIECKCRFVCLIALFGG